MEDSGDRIAEWQKLFSLQQLLSLRSDTSHHTLSRIYRDHRDTVYIIYGIYHIIRRIIFLRYHALLFRAKLFAFHIRVSSCRGRSSIAKIRNGYCGVGVGS